MKNIGIIIQSRKECPCGSRKWATAVETFFNPGIEVHYICKKCKDTFLIGYEDESDFDKIKKAINREVK